MEKQRIVSKRVLVVLISLLLLSMLGCYSKNTLGKKPTMELSSENHQQTLDPLDPNPEVIFRSFRSEFTTSSTQNNSSTFGDFRMAFKEDLKKSTLSQKVQDSVMVKVSAYTPSAEENGPNPMITASGTRVKSGVIAVSRNLYRKGWTFGKKVKIGDRVYIIQDLMSPTKHNHIDVFMWTKKEAFKWGCQKLLACLLIGDG